MVQGLDMQTTTSISSQRYLDESIVESKRAAADYVVTVYRVEVGGVSYDVVIDGHHSLAAAKADGAEPNYTAPCSAIVTEYDHEIAVYGTEAWLENHSNGDEYYDVSTGVNVW